jgi:hypothetical protein
MNELRINESKHSYEAYATFATEEERDAFIAKFPKSVRLWATTLGDLNGKKWACARFEVVLQSNAVVGEVNEAGLKRLAKFQEVLAKVAA